MQRRILLIGCASALAPAPGRAAATNALLAPTPAQTAGPFYPHEPPLETDTDLLRVAGAARDALGTPMRLTGRVLARDGRAIVGAGVEIWQCDANARYHHPRDRGAAPRDGGFQGYGRTRTTAAGDYRFRTIRPVPYPGRTAHVHVRVSHPDGNTLTTQLYLADEPGNPRDPIWRRLAAAGLAARVTVPAERIAGGGLAAHFDIVLA